VSSTCFEHQSVRPQGDLYMQFYGICFMHPCKESGRWQGTQTYPAIFYCPNTTLSISKNQLHVSAIHSYHKAAYGTVSRKKDNTVV